MYGMINEGIRDLVISLADVEAWEEICAELNLNPEGFEPLCPYDDSITYKLVASVSRRFGITQEDVLRRYGQHWIAFTAAQGYGEIMRLFGSDIRTCLENLNRMHGHLGAMMPNLSPPRFQVHAESAKRFVVHYHSHRAGLAPMVVGLLEGLAEKFNERISVNHISKGTRSDHDEFEVTLEAS